MWHAVINTVHINVVADYDGRAEQESRIGPKAPGGGGLLAALIS